MPSRPVQSRAEVAGPRARRDRPTRPRAAQARTFVILALAACAPLVSCGSDTPSRGGAVSPPVVRRVEPQELLPSDLDLVIRFDVGRMQASLGPAIADDLEERALRESGGETWLRDAIARAEVLWIGLRLADLEAGDRVIITEGKMGDVVTSSPDFQPVPTTVDGVTIFDRRGSVARAGTARVVRIGDRAIAFVSPVEVDSVTRVLRQGADSRRGDPAAEGIVSLDLRPRRLPTAIERRFPSIAAVIAGIERVRASAVPAADGVRIEAQIEGRNKASTERALRFLEALRDNVKDPRYVLLMRALTIEPIGDSIRLRWVLPAKALAALVTGAEEGAPKD